MCARLIAATVLSMLALGAMPARSDEYPSLNVAPLCHGIIQQSDLQEGLRNVSLNECLKAEQDDRDTMIKEWSSFSSSDKQHCIAEATMGGESSYTELLTCLEMARDVKQLHQEAGEQPKPEQGDSARRRKHSKHKQAA